MRILISTLFFGIAGAVLASANVTSHNWQFWVIMVCMTGVKFCGNNWSNMTH